MLRTSSVRHFTNHEPDQLDFICIECKVSLFGSSVTVGGFKPDKVIAIIFIHFWFVRRKKYILEKNRILKLLGRIVSATKINIII